MSDEILIKVSHLEKRFKDILVLKDINLTVKKNKIIAIIGPSGAGKSTFLRCLNLLEFAQRGHLEFDGLHFDFEKINKANILKLRRKSAMVFQQHNLFINKNVLENVAEALIVVKKIPKNQAYEKAKLELEKVGLKDKLKSYAYELSGGQAQRVGIARALAVEPSVLLFDEPTSALDVHLTQEVLEVIKNIKNKTMLIITHELNFARSIADEMIFMSEGRIMHAAPTKEFFAQKKDPIIEKFLHTEKLNAQATTNPFF